MRTALITGASRGIGRGIAQSLARQGFGLTVTSRNMDDLAALAIDLKELGAPEVVHQAADMADRHTLPSLVELHGATFGSSMNALVVNAGVGTAGNVADLAMRRVDKTIEVNLIAAVLLVQASLPLLRTGAKSDRERGATIVGISSIAGVYAEAGLAVYGASKAALSALLTTVNLEESGGGVKASSVSPAYVETDMSAWVTDEIPAETMLKVSDVVAVVDLLLRLGRTASIPSVVMTRSGTSGYGA
ncbi:SDR family oxidoreductase [Alloalcanivorax gelatiniphagus]